VKDDEQRTSTDAGIQIDSNDRQRENARLSILISFDPDSNATDKRE
jgi:hypothetical protein